MQLAMFQYQDIIDLCCILVIIIVNLLLWKVNTKHCLWYLGFIIIIGFVLPCWSSSREVQREVALHGDALDGFNMLYALFVFPKYWLVLIVQLLFLRYKN